MNNPELLRQRAREDGYLLIRDLLPKDLVLELRAQFIDICASYGWIMNGTDPMDGVADVAAINEISKDDNFIHIQGTVDVWTCWIPIGNCPSELGGLSVLRGSNRNGLLPVQEAAGAGNLEVQLCDWEQDWHHAPMEAGDILTFSSHTVHKALANAAGSRIRLSCDYRFQPADEDIEEKSLMPHCNVLEWDESLRWQKVRICD